jgi:hypothetical protein
MNGHIKGWPVLITGNRTQGSLLGYSHRLIKDERKLKGASGKMAL